MIFTTTYVHISNGTGTIYEGDCGKVRILDTSIHVVLNVLSTALVGASNYNMQCLAAPSRSEVDMAHSKGVWLDIGVPSVRNLRHISWRRVALWLALAISTIPLHLLWNSVFFSTLRDDSYIVIGASFNMLQDSDFNCEDAPWVGYVSYPEIACELWNSARARVDSAASIIKLEREECIEQYGTAIQAKWSNLVVVLDHMFLNDSCMVEPVASNEKLFFAYDTNGVLWSHGYDCDSTEVLATDKWLEDRSVAASLLLNSTDYFPSEEEQFYAINHCLATEGPKTCKLGFSLPILLVVIFSNATKLVAMICTLRIVQVEHLMTLGDAIASFLQVPDKSTSGCCLKTRTFFERNRSRLATHSSSSRLHVIQGVTTRKPVKLKWYQAPSKTRWSLTLIL